MLRIIVIGEEFYDEVAGIFSSLDDIVLDLEHSLLSLSKWESKFQKPFLGPGQKTTDEVLEYIRAMIVTPDPHPDVLARLSEENLSEINEYIDSKESATTFSHTPAKSGRGETVTSELIYYWMVTFNIPFASETWHLNRLFSLIRICNLKNSKPKKMSRGQIAQRNRELNAQRRAQLGTTG